jgi:lysophospholipase L1-like esterase
VQNRIMRPALIRRLLPGTAAGFAALLLAGFAAAQSPPNALLSQPETQLTITRVMQLMESTATAVPGLVRASDPLRQNTQTTAAALGKTLRDASLTLQFTNQIRAYLALADSLPRPDFFPSTASQQFLELRDELQRLDRHFQALLVREQVDAHANDADPYNLKRYAAANAKSLAPAPSLPRYVFMGDSATDLWRLNEYFTGKDFVNRGIAGQTTNQMLARFLADVVALRPMSVVVLAGSTDIAQGMTPSAIADNLVMMGDVAKAHSVQPIFASLLPAGGEAAKTRPTEAIQKVNSWIRDYCIRENYIYVDYYTAMADAKGMMKAELSDDGLNPNARGYRVMSPLLLDGIERLHDMMISAEDPAKPKRRSLPLVAK